MFCRRVAESELGQVVSLLRPDPVCWLDAARFADELSAGRYRPEWIWIAERRGEPCALGVWWGRPGGTDPVVLDHLWVSERVPDRAAVAADLVASAQRAFGATPEYQLRLPTGWRGRTDAAVGLAWRQRAVARAGLTEELERLQYEWTPADGLPAAGTRLVFRPEPDDGAFLDVFRRVAVGSLDTTSRRRVAALGAAAAAREDLAFYGGAPETRGWWRLAYTVGGALAGFGIPWRTPYGRNVGYLGVLPELRGNGYIDEVLADITRFHAAAGADRVTATTDLVNVPMRRAFERGGYRNVEVRMVLSAPSPTP